MWVVAIVGGLIALIYLGHLSDKLWAKYGKPDKDYGVREVENGVVMRMNEEEVFVSDDTIYRG